LQLSLSGSGLVQEEIVWTLGRLAGDQKERCEGDLDWPRADDMVLLVLRSMQSQPQCLGLQCACCSMLQSLVENRPDRGSLFIRNSGGEALLHAIDEGVLRNCGKGTDVVLVASMKLMDGLVHGNSTVAEHLRALGAADRLVSIGCSLDSTATDEIMSTLGQVGGPLAVLQLMDRSPRTISVGLEALSGLTWRSFEEGLQQQLEPALSALVGSAPTMADRPGDLCSYVGCVGGLTHMLTPYVAPNTNKAVDHAIGLLLQALQSGTAEVAKVACCSIGLIVVDCSAWRHTMQPAVEPLRTRIREPSPEEARLKDQKDYFWAFAAVAGLLQVLEEMRRCPQSANVQEAALSAFADVLKSQADCCDLEAWVDAEILQPHAVGGVIQTVIDSMAHHRERRPIQEFGCQTLGLLYMLLPAATDPLLDCIVDAVLAAFKRHNKDYEVVDMVVWTFSCFVEPPAGLSPAEGKAAVVAVADKLRARDVGGILPEVLKQFSKEQKVLARALYILTLVSGPRALLDTLRACKHAEDPLASAGLKALADAVRAVPDLLQLDATGLGLEFRVAVENFLREASGIADGSETQLVRHANMLSGLLGWR